MSRQLFDPVAQEYDKVRPDYPSQLFDALESAMGQPLLEAYVLDVGAGTGIASRALAGRGARVVALDPGPRMIEVLRSRSTSRVTPVIGDGNALPFKDSLFDLVTFAQSMHWTDPERAPAEALRVLKPGGVLAAWWNQHDLNNPWFAASRQRIFSVCAEPGFDYGDVARVLTQRPFFRHVATVDIPWSRPITIEDYGRLLRTKSYVLALGDQAAALVADEVRVLGDEFPQGILEEPFTTYAVLARA